MTDSDAPKIIIDDDWKSQAQAEKQRLAEVDRAAAEKKSADTEDAGEETVDFKVLLGTLAMQAAMYLGAVPTGPDGRGVVSLEHAKFHIDLMDVLEQKTRGNLTEAEAEEIKLALVDLRKRFVEVAQMVATMPPEGAAPDLGHPGMQG